jgi:hypothetical protein
MGFFSKIVSLALTLLAITLIGLGMYELVSPMIPFGPIGMIVAGILILAVMMWVGIKRGISL